MYHWPQVAGVNFRLTWRSWLRLQKKAPFGGTSESQTYGYIPRKRIWGPRSPKRCIGVFSIIIFILGILIDV